jgi:hypothetical protein
MCKYVVRSNKDTSGRRAIIGLSLSVLMKNSAPVEGIFLENNVYIENF